MSRSAEHNSEESSHLVVRQSLNLGSPLPIVGSGPPIGAQIAPKSQNQGPNRHFIADNRQHPADPGPNRPKKPKQWSESALHRRLSPAARRSGPKSPSKAKTRGRIGTSSPIIGSNPPIRAPIAPRSQNPGPNRHFIADYRQQPADPGPNRPQKPKPGAESALCRR